MALIDPRLLQTLQQQQIPVNSTLSMMQSLDRDMESVLRKNDVTEREKVRLYNDALQKYLTFENQRTSSVSPLPVKVVQDRSTPNPGNESRRSDIEREIVESVPKTMSKKARLLIDRIKSNPVMKWNDKGELIYKDNTIPGTNISDLINDVLRHRRQFTPRGWETFAQGLKDINAPQELVGNRERWQYMHHRNPPRSLGPPKISVPPPRFPTVIPSDTPAETRPGSRSARWRAISPRIIKTKRLRWSKF